MTTYGNLCTPNGDKINLTGGGQLGGEHPAKVEFVHRTHTLGGEVAKPTGTLKLRQHTLGGKLGNGAVTDTTPQPMKDAKAPGMGAVGY